MGAQLPDDYQLNECPECGLRSFTSVEVTKERNFVSLQGDWLAVEKSDSQLSSEYEELYCGQCGYKIISDGEVVADKDEITA